MANKAPTHDEAVVRANLRLLMKAHKLNRAQLARLAERSRGWATNGFKGKRAFGRKALAILASKINLDVGWFYTPHEGYDSMDSDLTRHGDSGKKAAGKTPRKAGSLHAVRTDEARVLQGRIGELERELDDTRRRLSDAKAFIEHIGAESERYTTRGTDRVDAPDKPQRRRRDRGAR